MYILPKNAHVCVWVTAVLFKMRAGRMCNRDGGACSGGGWGGTSWGGSECRGEGGACCINTEGWGGGGVAGMLNVFLGGVTKVQGWGWIMAGTVMWLGVSQGHASQSYGSRCGGVLGMVLVLVLVRERLFVVFVLFVFFSESFFVFVSTPPTPLFLYCPLVFILLSFLFFLPSFSYPLFFLFFLFVSFPFFLFFLAFFLISLFFFSLLPSFSSSFSLSFLYSRSSSSLVIIFLLFLFPAVSILFSCFCPSFLYLVLFILPSWFIPFHLFFFSSCSFYPFLMFLSFFLPFFPPLYFFLAVFFCPFLVFFTIRADGFILFCSLLFKVEFFLGVQSCCLPSHLFPVSLFLFLTLPDRLFSLSHHCLSLTFLG